MNTGRYKHVVCSMVIGSLLLVGLFLLLTGAPQVARADPDDWFVTAGGSGDCSQGDPCDLQTGLATAGDGDAIYVAQGTYTGTGGAVVTATQSITLYGGWDGTTTTPPVRDPDTDVSTLNGQGLRRVVYISPGVTCRLDGLHLTNGSATGQGGGIYAMIGSYTTLSDCQIYSNTASTHGGGAYFRGDATLIGNGIYSNTAQGNGGGIILVNNADTLLTGNQIHSNKGYWGGGVQTYQSDATLTNNDIYSNTAEDSGGGANINEADGNSVALTGNRIYSNTAMFGGGVIVGNCFVTMTGNLVYANSANQGAGVWLNSTGGMLVNEMVVANHVTSTNGASGLFVAGSDVRMLHMTIARNTGGRAGGILVTDFYGEASTVALTNTILVSHTVAILVDSGYTATLEATLWGDGDWANGTDWSGAGTITTGTINVWGVPAFRAPNAYDYHLLPTSAALDAGVDADVTTDMDGDLRPVPVGTSPDLGADEIDQRRAYLPLVVRNNQP